MKSQNAHTLRWITLTAALAGAVALAARWSRRETGAGSSPRPRHTDDQLEDLYSTTRCHLGEPASFPLRCSSTPPST